MCAWFDDEEIRAAYGAQSLQYAMAFAVVQAREACGLTQAELAQRAGVRVAYLGRVERGEANPTLAQLGALFAALGCRADITVCQRAEYSKLSTTSSY